MLKVLALTRLMGDTISETVRRIMQKIFTDKFLSNYSYIGHKGKLKLSNLQSCTIIFGKYFKKNYLRLHILFIYFNYFYLYCLLFRCSS